MRNSASGTKDEKLKSAYQDAKKAKKKAKAGYRAKLKELKAKLKPMRQAIKEAERAEKQAKAALKALEENQSNGSATNTPKAVAPKATAEPAAPKKRGRQPGYSPKAAKAAAATTAAPAKVKGKPGRKPAEKPATSSSGSDDLTQVKGVGENIAVMLRANGVKSYSDMAGTSFDRYKELLKANGMSKFRDPSQWAVRAAALANMPAPALAAKAEPAPKVKGKPGRKPAEKPAAAEPIEKKKRGRQPGYSPKAAKGVVNHEEGYKAPKAKAVAAGSDDLTQVKGVGENIAVMLRANGVKSYSDMAGTSFDRYKELLKANGMSKFRDPSQWAARAAALANMPAPAPVAKAEPAPKVKGKPGRKPAEKPVAAEPVEKKKRGRQPGYSPKAAKAAAGVVAAPAKAKAAAAPTAEPAEKKKRGRQPGYSPKAAKAAAAAAPAKAAAAPAKAAAPKAPAKPKGPPAKPDDLTQVKGVGGRVAEALNKEGIYTYRDMAAVSLDRYKEILKDNNMSKFRDPSDWAKVAAELAAKK